MTRPSIEHIAGHIVSQTNWTGLGGHEDGFNPNRERHVQQAASRVLEEVRRTSALEDHAPLPPKTLERIFKAVDEATKPFYTKAELPKKVDLEPAEIQHAIDVNRPSTPNADQHRLHAQTHAAELFITKLATHYKWSESDRVGLMDAERARLQYAAKTAHAKAGITRVSPLLMLLLHHAEFSHQLANVTGNAHVATEALKRLQTAYETIQAKIPN